MKEIMHFDEAFLQDKYETPKGRRSFLSYLLPRRFLLHLGWWHTFVFISRKNVDGVLPRLWSFDIYKKCIVIAEKMGAIVKIEGINNIRNLDDPPVIIGNHMSMVETVTIGVAIEQIFPNTFIVKENLIKIPYFGDILTGIKAIGVTRDNPREDLKRVLKQGCKVLDEKAVVVFPQSTRSFEFKPDEFSTIGVKLAKKAKRKIIPLALKTDFLKPGKGKLKELGPIDTNKAIRYSFGEPIEVEGNGAEAHQKVINFIQNKLQEWEKMD